MNSSRAVTSQSLFPPALMDSSFLPVLSVGLGFLIIRYLLNYKTNTQEASLSGKDIQPISKQPGKPQALNKQDVGNLIREYINVQDFTTTNTLCKQDPLLTLLEKESKKFEENVSLIKGAQTNKILSKEVKFGNLGQEEFKKIADKIRQDDLTFLRSLQQANHIAQSLDLEALSCKDRQEKALEFHNESTIKAFPIILEALSIPSSSRGSNNNALKDIQPISEQARKPQALNNQDVGNLIGSYLNMRDLTTTTTLCKQDPLLTLVKKESEKFEENVSLIKTAQTNRILPKDIKFGNLGQEEFNKIADKIRQDDLTFLKSLQQANHIDQSLDLDALSCKDRQEKALEFHNESTIKAFPIILEALSIPSSSRGSNNNALEIRDFLYEHKEQLTNIRWLGLNGLSLKSIPLELKYFTGLEALDLSGNQISDITPVETLKRLIALDLSDNQIFSINPLATLTNLEELKLSKNRISSINPIAILTRLRTLRLSRNQISSINPIETLTRLRTLGLSGNQISSINPLATLTNLKGLDLSDNQISIINPLATLTKLEELNLSHNQISSTNPLATLTNLKRLYLSKNRISSINPLATLTKLEGLNLSDNQISSINPIETLTRLTTLGLSDNQISIINPLATLTNLKGLYLSKNRISSINPLATLTKLEGLNLSDNQISSINPLATLTKLEGLNLSDNQISSINPLATLTNLEELVLSGNQISNIPFLVSLTALKKLDLHNNQIFGIGPLSTLRALQVLDLTSEQISNLYSEIYDLNSLLNNFPSGLLSLTILHQKNKDLSIFLPQLQQKFPDAEID